MDKKIMYLCAGLGLLCAFLGGFDVLFWNTNRSQDQTIRIQAVKLNQIQTARATEKRATVLAAYNQCIGAIKTIGLANTIIDTEKDLLLSLARSNENRAALETSPSAKQFDLNAAAARRARAAELHGFPPVTKKQCIAIRNRDLPPLPNEKKKTKTTTTTPES